MGSIIVECRNFVILIDEVTEQGKLRLIEFKAKIKGFLIYKVRHLIAENRKSVIVIRIDNVKEYKSIVKELADMGVVVEFFSVYTAY